MVTSPKAKARPQVYFNVYKGNKDQAESLTGDIGSNLKSLEMQAMANGGYTIRAKFADFNFNTYNKLIESGYFERARKEPMKVQLRCKWDNKAKHPESASKLIIAFIISLEATQPTDNDYNILEFVAIDPPSWYLNAGNASGKCYTGNIGSVIRQVIEEYSPQDRLQLDIATTNDSKQGKWWLMRQDPKSFMSSLFDWSASVTESKTQWVFAPANYNLTIKPQGLLSSTQRRYYSFHRNKQNDNIKSVSLLTDNALSAVQTKLITQGLSTISGQYLDYQTSREKVQVYDDNTQNKQVAKVSKGRSFQKPPEGLPPNVGYTSVMAIPEIGSSGDLGIPYEDYIDGRPRSMYLNMVNNLMKAKITVLGDGIWSSCDGLGIDTIFVDWVQAASSTNPNIIHWYSGSWLVYGFYHKITPKFWTTDIYCARFDQNSAAVKVGGNNPKNPNP